ncbi:hypothetical protein YB2330_005849 [Saitoella coloradoensis]
MGKGNDILFKGAIPEVHYYDFGAKGRGEVLRVFLHEAEIEYKDSRIPIEEWPKYKEKFIASGFNPVGKIPVLQTPTGNYTQSIPTIRYLSKRLGKYFGRSLEEEYECDRIADVGMDHRRTWASKVVYGDEITAKDFKENVAPEFLRQFEIFYSIKHGDYLLGDEVGEPPGVVESLEQDVNINWC